MIDRVEEKYGCLVVALVTDNDGGSQSGRKKSASGSLDQRVVVIRYALPLILKGSLTMVWCFYTVPAYPWRLLQELSACC